MKVKSWLCAAALGVGLLGAGQSASADPITLHFDVIDRTETRQVHRDVESQFSVVVSEVASNPNQVLFTFLNQGSIRSSITDVYFQDGTLLGPAASASLTGSGVNFSWGAEPGDLPGGEELDPEFHVTAGFSADSNTPVPQNGVNNTLLGTEYLNVVFDLQSGLDFDDVAAALTRPPPSTTEEPSLRIGFRVQDFADGSSAAYVNVRPPGGGGETPKPVPLPGVVWAGLALMGGIGAKRLRRKVA